MDKEFRIRKLLQSANSTGLAYWSLGIFDTLDGKQKELSDMIAIESMDGKSQDVKFDLPSLKQTINPGSEVYTLPDNSLLVIRK